eukprot:gene47535-63733_t
MLSLWLGAYDQGLAYAGLALGTYLTLRVLNFPDLTVDGSFALGGGAAAAEIGGGGGGGGGMREQHDCAAGRAKGA